MSSVRVAALLSVLWTLPAAADRPSQAGESCSRTADCAPTLVCVRQECRPGRQVEPEAEIVIPKRARTMLQAVVSAVHSFNLAHRRLPDSLRAVVRAGHLRAFQVVDYWGTDYVYRPSRSGDGRGYRVCSAGPDRVAGSDDDLCQRGRAWRVEHAVLSPN